MSPSTTALPLGDVKLACALEFELEVDWARTGLACDAASLTQPIKPQNSKANVNRIGVRYMECGADTPARKAGDAARAYLVVEVEDEPMPDCEPELELVPVPIEDAPVLPVVPDELEAPPGRVDVPLVLEAPVLPEVPLRLDVPPAGAVDELSEAPDEPMPERLDESDEGEALEEPDMPEEPEEPDEPEAPMPELLEEPEELSGALDDELPDP